MRARPEPEKAPAASPSPHGRGPSGGTAKDLRCGCGSLLARLVSGGVELKCRRCKRTWTVPLESS